MAKTKKPNSFLGRILFNLARFPKRTLQSIGRLADTNFRLEREAGRYVDRWLSKERQHELDTISGMSSAHECRLLAYLTTQAPAGGDVVEIGAWKGKSTAWLVEAAQSRPDQPAVVSIDPHQWDSWDTFSQTVRRFDLAERGLKVHRALSHEVGHAWKRPISMLWVDGCHDYDEVLQDINDFTPHMVPGGWIVFDDATGGICPGVERAIAQHMHLRPGFQHVATIRHLDVFRRHS